MKKNEEQSGRRLQNGLREKAEAVLAKLDHEEKEVVYVFGLLEYLRCAEVLEGGNMQPTNLGLEAFHSLEDQGFHMPKERIQEVTELVIENTGGMNCNAY